MRTLILACKCLLPVVLFLAPPNVLSQEEQMPMSNTTLVVAESANVTQNYVADDGLMVGTNITYNDAANSIDEECGLEVKVGCVLANTAEDESPLDCNSYIPKTAQDCFMQVRYTYHVDKDDKLSGMKLVSALRYRDGSYWEAQHGNPRPFSESRWDTMLTVKGGYYRMDQWEGEVVNFCQSQSVVTRFDFNVDESDSAGNSCSRSDTYTLTTAGGETGTANGQNAGDSGSAHDSSGAGTSDAATASSSASIDCPLEIELTCMIDTDGDERGDVDCNEYDPIASGLSCDAKAIYSHKLYNKAPWNSGIDVNFMEISRTRVGDLPHGDYYDFLDKVLGGNLLLEAMYQTTIRELPTINFCQPVQDIYATTFDTISSTDGGITVCENKAEYILDMVNRRR